MITTNLSNQPDNTYERRTKILSMACIKPCETIFDAGTGDGFLSEGIYQKYPGKCTIIAADISEENLKNCKKRFDTINVCEDCITYLKTDLRNIQMSDNRIDVIVSRYILTHIIEKQQVFNEFYRILRPEGRLILNEPVIRMNTAFYELVDIYKLNNAQIFIDAEKAVRSDPGSPLTDFDPEILKNYLKKSGFNNIHVDYQTTETNYHIKDNMMEQWFTTFPGHGAPSIEQGLLRILSSANVQKYKNYLITQTRNCTVTVKTTDIYISTEK
jgi:ubiquinone/menaquinone biosynthesis C-methylase UbiE